MSANPEMLADKSCVPLPPAATVPTKKILTLLAGVPDTLFNGIFSYDISETVIAVI